MCQRLDHLCSAEPIASSDPKIGHPSLLDLAIQKTLAYSKDSTHVLRRQQRLSAPPKLERRLRSRRLGHHNRNLPGLPDLHLLQRKHRLKSAQRTRTRHPLVIHPRLIVWRGGGNSVGPMLRLRERNDLSRRSALRKRGNGLRLGRSDLGQRIVRMLLLRPAPRAEERSGLRATLSLRSTPNNADLFHGRIVPVDWTSRPRDGHTLRYRPPSSLAVCHRCVFPSSAPSGCPDAMGSIIS